MDYEAQLKLQACLDGELSEAEAKDVTEWVSRDQDATLLFAELKNTRQALAGSEIPRKLPESREFFWSKIERGISRLEAPRPEPVRESLLSRWRRLLIPLSAAAALGIIILITVGPSNSSLTAESEVATEDTGSFVYRDDSGTTLIWLSYPAENDVADEDGGTTL
jgi:anti-sigma factor RsiW